MFDDMDDGFNDRFGYSDDGFMDSWIHADCGLLFIRMMDLMLFVLRRCCHKYVV